MGQAIIATSRVREARAAGLVEWRTLGLILGCHAAWIVAGLLFAVAPILSIALLALTIAFHSSLQHEAIHGHPTGHEGVNEALMCLPLGLLVPYRRYRRLHRLHHADSRLTDPYDDPESYYLTLRGYRRLPPALRTLLGWNNMLAGRMLIGPALTATGFLLTEARSAVHPHRCRTAPERGAWALHLAGLIVVAAIVRFGFRMPLPAYFAGAYLGLSLLAVRSFCEHRWAERPDERTVIVERSLLGLLFLNNNLHLVHHKQPGLPWYELPAAYAARREEWRALNGGYVFRGYGAVMRGYGLRAKEPVIHPAETDRAAAPASPPASRRSRR